MKLPIELQKQIDEIKDEKSRFWIDILLILGDISEEIYNNEKGEEKCTE